MKRFTLALAILSLSAIAFSASAQQQQRRPGPDLAALASQIGVSTSALEGCMGPGPSGQGERPAEGQRPPRPEAGAIASCLTEAGHKVSADSVDSALAASAPRRP
ncbi:hypothetical protein [Vannielia litorea]|uniref:Uncharacterized protein n=1 Tax=Vannielia litorea TaxID=1217970 RepID=A0A1N6IMH2_9RHOB|nr:hypothetical protein [Vannielia litorea]SIO33241.1 hypothetical protein SAMN05444002_4079 [Vannielia litorea]